LDQPKRTDRPRDSDAFLAKDTRASRRMVPRRFAFDPTTEALVVKILRPVVRDPKCVARDPGPHSLGTLKFYSLVAVSFGCR